VKKEIIGGIFEFQVKIIDYMANKLNSDGNQFMF